MMGKNGSGENRVEPEVSRRQVVLRIFTHPACSGCGPAVEMGWKLARRYRGVKLETVKLEHKEGLRQAQREGIRTIPTLITYLGDEEQERFVGLPREKSLEDALEQLLQRNGE
jgi:thioredoxin-like negative regulator of GroEL